MLIVDECRHSGGSGKALMVLIGKQNSLPHARITAEDSFIATSPAYAATLSSTAAIIAAVTALIRR